MGWVFYHRPKGETDRDHFQKELDARHTIVECASIDNVFYAAVHDEKTSEVWAFIALFRRQRGEHNFGYKSMTETMGPAATDAPAKVLDALTSTTNEYAVQWRQQCRETLTKRATARARRKAVTVGVVIQTASPLHFANDQVASRFECIARSGRTLLWRAIPPDGDQFVCRLGSDWAERHQWEIVPADTAAVVA